MIRRRGLSALCCAVMLCAGSGAFGEEFGFVNITGNNPIDAEAGEAQLFFDVTPAGANEALFTFFNIGPAESSITDIYFDDSGFLSLIMVDDSESGVDFSPGGSPPNLPGGGSVMPPFEANVDLTISANPPPSSNGVNPGESVGVVYELGAGVSFDYLIDPLIGGEDGVNEDLRVGIHVQGFDGGGSESFIGVPDPATGLLLATATGLLGMARRRRTRAAR